MMAVIKPFPNEVSYYVSLVSHPTPHRHIDFLVNGDGRLDN